MSLARLLNRAFELDPEHCPNRGAGELKIIAAILERSVIVQILAHLRPAPQPLPKSPPQEPGSHFSN